MLCFTCAWADMSCTTKLKIVAGLMAKQTGDRALLTAPLPLAFTPSREQHVSSV